MIRAAAAQLPLSKLRQQTDSIAIRQHQVERRKLRLEALARRDSEPRCCRNSHVVAFDLQLRCGPASNGVIVLDLQNTTRDASASNGGGNGFYNRASVRALSPCA